jgi:DNA-binding transcriptional LysR family regulator
MEVDFYVGPPPHRSSLQFEPTFKDSYVVLFERTHKFAGRRTIKFDELNDLPLVAMSRGTNIREVVDAHLAAHNKSISSKFEVLNLYTVGGMVEAGLGLSIVPSMALDLINNRRLRYARLVEPEISRQIGIVRRRGETMSAASLAFLDTMKPTFFGKQRAK